MQCVSCMEYSHTFNKVMPRAFLPSYCLGSGCAKEWWRTYQLRRWRYLILLTKKKIRKDLEKKKNQERCMETSHGLTCELFLPKGRAVTTALKVRYPWVKWNSRTDLSISRAACFPSALTLQHLNTFPGGCGLPTEHMLAQILIL